MKINFHTIEFMSAEADMGCKFEFSSCKFFAAQKLEPLAAPKRSRSMEAENV